MRWLSCKEAATFTTTGHTAWWCCSSTMLHHFIKSLINMDIFGGTRGNIVRMKQLGAGVWALEDYSVWPQDKGQAAALSFLNERHYDRISGKRVLLPTNARLQSPEELWWQDDPSLLWLLVNQHHYGFVDSRIYSICILLSPNRHGRGSAFVLLLPNTWLSYSALFHTVEQNKESNRVYLFPCITCLYSLTQSSLFNSHISRVSFLRFI